MRTDMHPQIGAMLEEYRAMRSRVGDLQLAAANVATTVRSPDRGVSVTVGAHGELQDLRIEPAAARLDPWVLAQRILAAARLATDQSREQLRTMTRDALPESLRDLVGPDGSVDMLGLLPAGADDVTWGRVR